MGQEQHAIAHALIDTLTTQDNPDQEQYQEGNVVDALFQIAKALDNVAVALQYLGNGNAATNMGAIEALGLVMKEGMASSSSSIIDGLSEVAIAQQVQEVRSE
jgi:hypothetical protein